jgi:hypothetical protein
MFEYLLNEKTVIQAAYDVGQQAKVFNYNIFSAWQNLIHLLYLDKNYSNIKIKARQSYLQGYYNS